MRPPILPRQISPCGAAYYAAGSGAAAVLLHGVGLRAECWFPQIRRLRRCCAVYAPDLPGHGATPKLGMPAPQISDFAAHIARFLRETVRRPALLIGHSAGAQIAFAAAARFPQHCRGAAMLNAVYRRTPEARAAVLARAESLRGDADCAAPLLRWFGEKPAGRARRAAAFCREWLRAADREGYAALYRAFGENDGPAANELSAFDAPLFLLTGENDANSAPEMSRKMAARAPHGRAEIVRGAGHLMQLTHAAEVNNALAAFAADCETMRAAKTNPAKINAAKTNAVNTAGAKSAAANG
ncbi:MAG: alpha/beta fold hydrolase [Gammaproteobacteria bacterium]